MQAQTNLPIVASQGTTAGGATMKGASGSDDAGGAQFSQALHREMGQRQSQASAAAQTQPGQARVAAQADRTQTGTPTSHADAPEPDAQGSAPEGSIVADLTAITPVTDMLALAAALNPPRTTAAAVSAGTSANAEAEAQTGIAGLEPARATAATVAGPALAVDPSLAALAVAPMTAAVAAGAGNATAEPAPTAGTDAGKAQPAQAEMATRDVPAGASAPTDLRPGARPAGQATFAALAAQTGSPAAAAIDSAPQVPVADKPAELLQAALPGTPAQQPLAAVRPEAAAAAVRDHLPARVGSQGWDQQLGNRIVLMAGTNEQIASLTLNPPDLGPMQIVLAVSDDKASVAFTSAQPEVRLALEAAMPRLRGMLGETGIALGDATVSAGTPGDHPRDESPRRQHGSGTSPAGDVPAARQPARPVGLVDTFA